MPPRISRTSLASTTPRSVRRGSKKRSLNAFAIASAAHPENPQVKRSRLGESEGDAQERKKRRIQEDEDEDSEQPGLEGQSPSPLKKAKGKAKLQESEFSEGSDSEGNTWKMGHVDEDDDSELDSDEAFGEGDEERFANFSFSGSTQNKKPNQKQKQKPKGKSKSIRSYGIHGDNGEEVNLDEQDQRGSAEDDEDSLGGDAVDLADMLEDDSEGEAEGSAEGASKDDSTNEEEEPEEPEEPEDESNAESDAESDAESEDDAAFSDSDISQHDDDVASGKLNKLQELVSSLHPEDRRSKIHRVDPHEYKTPSAAGLVSSEKFDIRDLLSSTNDTELARISKRVGTIPKQPKKDPKLAPALPQSQKNKLDRIAANEKAKETLGRWVDTVKHLRRAEHLTFPLRDPEAAIPFGKEHLLPQISTNPMTELESTIKSILEESGLAPNDVEHDEAQNPISDELPEKEISVQEVLARRAELRKARDLLFREEARSKRVKKIKSKSYRRVHRREREKLAALENDAFADGDDAEMDEEERQLRDRRRAEERMGSKHRDSRWAKQMKKSGRSIWDDDARTGVSEMARRNEELRRRIAGKEVRNGGDDADPDAFSSSESEGAFSDEDEEAARLRRTQRRLDQLAKDSSADHQESTLSSMKFMQRAEAARRAQNNEDIARIQREIDGRENSDEFEVDNDVGRKLFGPVSREKVVQEPYEERNEFEEVEDFDDDEDDDDVESAPLISTVSVSSKAQEPSYTNGVKSKTFNSGKITNQSTEHPKPDSLPKEIHSQPDAEGWITVTYDQDDENEDVNGSDVESVISQTQILRRAFAGDDVEADFEKEKQDVIDEEDEKMIDDTLPGWGNWVGDGVSKREQKRNKSRLLSKQEGIRPQDRKDAKLKNVIINQKRLRKNVDYLAPALPFPFTTKTEYERSIRMPIGGEWNVKDSYMANTKPKVIVKPGKVILPIDKPLM